MTKGHWLIFPYSSAISCADHVLSFLVVVCPIVKHPEVVCLYGHERHIFWFVYCYCWLQKLYT